MHTVTVTLLIHMLSLIYSELHMMQFDATWMLCFAHMDAGQQGCLQFILQSQVWSPEGSLYGNLSAASGTVTL